MTSPDKKCLRESFIYNYVLCFSMFAFYFHQTVCSSFQHALRLIAFRQIHKVLGMDPLPAGRFAAKRFNNRKRRHTNSTGEDGKISFA